MDETASEVAAETVVTGVLVHDGCALLVRRAPDRATWPGLWDAPGGHIEAGETPEQALVRELDEELGVTPLRFELLVRLDLPNPYRAGPLTYHCYRVDQWQGDPVNRQPEEHAEIAWLAPAEIETLPLADPSQCAVFLDLLAREAPRR